MPFGIRLAILVPVAEMATTPSAFPAGAELVWLVREMIIYFH